jgi:PIF1-like helicase/DNA helicase Pif1-like protein
MFMITGHGGTGKTFLYKVICSKLRSESAIVLCTASSGIAALLLPGGRTAHSMFKIPIDSLSPKSFCCIPKNSARADLMRAVKCIIWDEIVPQHRFVIETLDRTLRDLRDNDQPFGGITLLMGGDFLQTLPAIPKGTRKQILEATITHSYLWNDIEIIHLHQNMRLRHDPQAEEFAEWLLDIGHGRNSDENGEIQIPQNMCCNNIESLMNFVYPNLNSSPPPPPDYFLNQLILAPLNSDVNAVNEALLDEMSGDVKIYYSTDQVIHESGADMNNHNDLLLTTELLQSIKSNSLPPGELRIKIGCPLILMRNLSPSTGLCNGSRMIVKEMSERVLQVLLIGGDHDGENALIPRISLIPTSTPDFSFQIRRRQFPVRLAFAATINRAQGQSVKYVGLDFRNSVFTHGQLYVGFSRVIARENLRVLLPEDCIHSKTINIVYEEALI